MKNPPRQKSEQDFRPARSPQLPTWKYIYIHASQRWQGQYTRFRYKSQAYFCIFLKKVENLFFNVINIVNIAVAAMSLNFAFKCPLYALESVSRYFTPKAPKSHGKSHLCSNKNEFRLYKKRLADFTLLDPFLDFLLLTAFVITIRHSYTTR